MTGTDRIPDNVKWKIASAYAARLPALYDAAFREIAGKRYNEIERTIWMELSRTAFEIARTLSLPVGSAEDLARTMQTVFTLLFGPEFRSESLKVSEDRAVIIVKHCPLLNECTAAGCSGDAAFHRCMAFTLTAVPRLNKTYAARFVRTMCSGDRQCEITVGKAEDLGQAL